MKKELNVVKKEVSKIRKLSDVEDIKFLEFGIKELDEISGIPIGHLTTIHGEAHVGKTDLALRIAVHATKAGKKVLYWDAENRLNPKRFTALGGDRELLWFANGCVQEEVAEEVMGLVDKDYDLIIIDSIASLQPRAIRDSDIGDANIGIQAKMSWKWIRALQAKLPETNCAVVFISQIKQGFSMFKPTYIAGGDGILYGSSLILRLSSNNSSDNILKDGKYVGRKIHGLITKSNLGELRDGEPWNYHKQEAVFKLMF